MQKARHSLNSAALGWPALLDCRIRLNAFNEKGLSFLQLLPDFVVGGTGAKAGVGDDFADGHFRVLDLLAGGVGEPAVVDTVACGWCQNTMTSI